MLIFIAFSVNLCDGWNLLLQTHIPAHHLNPYVLKLIVSRWNVTQLWNENWACLMGTSNNCWWLHEVKKLKCRFKINKKPKKSIRSENIFDSCELQHYSFSHQILFTVKLKTENGLLMFPFAIGM